MLVVLLLLGGRGQACCLSLSSLPLFPLLLVPLDVKQRHAPQRMARVRLLLRLLVLLLETMGHAVAPGRDRPCMMGRKAMQLGCMRVQQGLPRR